MKKINPFHELYVTETIPPQHFIDLFSPYLVKTSLALFQPGNVVLMGVQGSGKSMLLNLLKTEIRLAYLKAGKDLPIPNNYKNFIGAGINILRSGAMDLGQRPIESDESSELQVLPLYFGDFVNYWIVSDLLHSIELMCNKIDGKGAKCLGLKADTNKLNAFAEALSRDDCWFGYFKGIVDYASLKQKISDRIQTYRRFINYNIERMPTKISETKTSIGEPISKTAEFLWQIGVVPSSILLYVRIDQYEGLSHLEGWGGELGLKFQRIINKALGTREPRVSYRIGVRRYGWQFDLKPYGSTTKIEKERDYKVVDIDKILRRGENRVTWIFPGFAKDVFTRRVKYAGYQTEAIHDELETYIMGRGLSSEEKAKKYAGTSPLRAVKVEDTWPEGWRDLIQDIAKSNPLSARLGEAWARQMEAKLPQNLPPSPLPWEKPGKRYWRKERIPQALMQIAGRCGERMIWAGWDDILALSGGNILVFVSICQHIWDMWIQSIRESDDVQEEDMRAPRIESKIQAMGIQAACTYWYHKIPELPGGDGRQRFITLVGAMFHKLMLEDHSMSYPGRNGFSLRIENIVLDKNVRRFLREAVDYGDLYDAPHTTKSKDGKHRIKWYLKPILSPYYRIPEQRTKEPMYTTIKAVRDWIIKSEALPKEETQLTLFDLRQGE